MENNAFDQWVKMCPHSLQMSLLVSPSYGKERIKPANCNILNNKNSNDDDGLDNLWSPCPSFSM